MVCIKKTITAFTVNIITVIRFKFTKNYVNIGKNNKGENTPPCLTPAVKETGSAKVLFHRILAEPIENQCSITLIM